MRGLVGLAVVLGLAVASAPVSAAPAERCIDLKLAQAASVLGKQVKLAEKDVVRERVCTAKVGGAVAATVRSRSALDFDWVVAGLKDERVLVKQLKPVALGDKGYSYDRYAGSAPAFSQRVLVFKAGARMYSVEIPARRLLAAAKHMALARQVARNARAGGR